MAPDDRDRNFEKALARHLRSSASPSKDGTVLGGGASERPGELCPDAEILAAYHDGSLSSEERNLWKQHVVACERCQLVLAHLETSLEVPVNLGTNEKVVALPQNAAFGRAASPAPIARPSPPHNLRWLWLVPVGAVAATLIAWVSLNTPKPSETASSQPVEVAENRPTPGVAPPAKTTRVTPNEAVQNERKEKDQLTAPSAAGAAPATRDLDSKQPQSQVQPTQQSPFQAAGKPAHGPSLSQQKQEQQQRMGFGEGRGDAGAQRKKSLDAQLSDKAGDRLEEVQRPQAVPPPPPPPPPAPSFIADGSVSPPVAGKAGSVGGAAPAPAAPAPPPASNAAAPKASAANADAFPTITESVEVSAAPQSLAKARAQEYATMRAASLQNPHVFWTPNGKQAWRVGPAGSLEYSKDKGATWVPQISGVYTDLVAGSAPSGKVCWVVGTSGTILRTTDGGTHWSKLDSPVVNDITGVHATDATHASISFVPDARTGFVTTYETSDGGRTWFSAPTDH
jgi:hypothetical protein